MRFSRRRFLASSIGAGAAVALADGIAAGAGRLGRPVPEEASLAAPTNGVSATAAGAAPKGAVDQPEPKYVPFDGAHQHGIITPPPAAGLMAAFDVTASDLAELRETLQAITTESRALMTGEPYEDRESAYPPLHAGTLGSRPPKADLSIVAAVGASLFDDRFGLADQAPRELVKMPFFKNDRLDPARTHGDLLLSLSADTPDVNIFALRQLMRRTRGELTLKWMIDGFNRRSRPQPGKAPVRNLMGFRDGTSNLDAADEAEMRRHVWVGPEDDEPAWTVGGSYMAVRIIRMFVEFWDRTPLAEQEAIIGRRKESGAPMDGKRETDIPNFAKDRDGDKTPLDAHIRLANPRTKETEDNLLLRRGFSFSRGFDGAGRLDQGLAYVSFQRSLEQGFVAVQSRLDGEPLEEYIQPQGGGYFFAFPGVRTRDEFLGERLVGA